MKQVGVLSFHPAFTPPSSGGELRLYHLLKQVADAGFGVELLSPTYGHHEQETVQHAPGFQETRFPKSKAYNAGHQMNDRFWKFSECSGLVCSLACRSHEAMRREAERLNRTADVFVHEYSFLVPLAPRRGHAKQLFVYDAHNVEANLARSMFGNGWKGRIAAARIKSLEKQLVRDCDLLLVTSEGDIDVFAGLYGADRSKMVLVPNGTDVNNIRPCPSLQRRMEAREILGLGMSRPAAFFIGSFHPPNIEAVDVILHRLARQIPEVDFLIAGKVCNAFANQQMPDNVRLLGLISEEQKQALFHATDVALNPMLSGSGTNLKMLEYLAAGLPILSTPTGARGIDIEHHRHAVIASPEEMQFGLEELLSDAHLRTALATEARALAEEKYSWESIGRIVADLYTLKTSKRLIIMNDYAVMPAEQGGQVRVEAVAKGLADRGVGVTLLTLTGAADPRRIQENSHLEEINIPRSRVHRAMDGLLANLVGCGADDVSALLLTRWLTPNYRRALDRELRFADGVMLSHPYLESLSHGLPEGTKLYYDSHNTEYDLKKKLYKKSPRLSNFLINAVFRAETSAARRSDATFCVSDENRHQLMEVVPYLDWKSYVCPNGVDCDAVHVRSGEERRALRQEVGFGREFIAVFLGSGHPPNAEAARLIIERIARDHPRVLFLLVGSVCGWFWNKHLPGNVLVMGLVSTPVKNFLLQTSDFALNPMLTGSGTSLKLFDYMAAGLPVLSTVVGARGLDREALEAVVLLEPEDFSRGLRQLMADPVRCERLAQRARRVAEEHFDWSVALHEMGEVIARDLAVELPGSPSPESTAAPLPQSRR